MGEFPVLAGLINHPYRQVVFHLHQVPYSVDAFYRSTQPGLSLNICFKIFHKI